MRKARLLREFMRDKNKYLTIEENALVGYLVSFNLHVNFFYFN